MAPEPTTPEPITPLDAGARVVRTSLALRGRFPAPDEVEAVLLDADALPGIVDAYLDSPDFGAVVRQAHGEWWLTDTYKDYYPGGFYAFGPLRDLDDNAVNVSVQQSVGRLAQHIVDNDLPYTEVVLADYVLADDVVATVWGLPYDEDLGGWQTTSFEDGRPMAGMLSDPWLYVRHASTVANRQRARAAHVSRALLCHDYMGREVRVPEGTDLTAGGRNALEDNDVCASCHHTLDPLGAFFAPFEGVVVPQGEFSYPVDIWDPGISNDYQTPRYYGTEGSDLRDLAVFIAEDPRFARCTVRRFYGQLRAMDAEMVEESEIDRFLPAFLDSGLRVRGLVRAIVLDDAFADAAALQRTTPWQLDRAVRTLLNGPVWEGRGYNYGSVSTINLVEDITYGYRTLAGGADGLERWNPIRTVDPTSVLVLRGLLAHQLGSYVEREALGAVTDEGDVRARIAALHRQLYGTAATPDDALVDEAWQLFSTLSAVSTPERAWEVTLGALLQDPRVFLH